MPDVLREHTVGPFDPDVHQCFVCRCQHDRITKRSEVQTREELYEQAYLCRFCGEDALILKCWCGRVVDKMIRALGVEVFGRMIFQCRPCARRGYFAGPEFKQYDKPNWLELDGTFGMLELLDSAPWPSLETFWQRSERGIREGQKLAREIAALQGRDEPVFGAYIIPL